ncbi:winged helix DNA-binding domain-containing protein, partial [Imleria badia]
MDSTRSAFPDAGPYLRQQLGLSADDAISLQSLPDPPAGEKPSAPLPMLIKLAIYGSPNQQLTLQEIYNELENRFQWFREHKHDKAWKNSIRHNLSLNKVFRNVPRPITEPGKGSYWQLD